jgi:folate-binding protein YgfZ
LQNQLSNDIAGLPLGRAAFAAWCTAQGRMVATGLVCPLAEDRFLFAAAADIAEELRTRLSRYVLRSKLRIESAAPAFSLAGFPKDAPLPAPLDALRLPSEALAAAPDAGGRQCAIRLPDGRALAFLPAGALPENAGLDDRQWRRADIESGCLWIGAAAKELFTPHMADFDKVGVSFKKGCYPGQEVVARTQYLGKSKRHLYRLACAFPIADGQPFALPASPQQKIGDIACAEADGKGGFIGLASLLDEAAAGLPEASRVFPE